MSALTPRERRQQRTQQAIIDAARQIIRDAGINALSMRAIAECIDYSPAGLYEYFGSKEEIIGAVCKQGIRRLAGRLQQVDPTLAPIDYVVELGMAYIDFAIHNTDWFLLMFTTVPLARNAMPPVLPADPQQSMNLTPGQQLQKDDAFGILVGGIQRCVAAGILHEQPNFGVLEMAYAAWAHVHGIAMLHATGLQIFADRYEAVNRTVLRSGLFGLGVAAAAGNSHQ